AIAELSDKEALLAMDAENRAREDISPYERAIDYKKWIEAGIYQKQADICEEIGIKKSIFSQTMALAELDKTIVEAFGSPANLKIRWGYKLYLACKDKITKEKMISVAIKLKNQGLPPAVVCKKLFAVTSANGLLEINEVWIKNRENQKIL